MILHRIVELQAHTALRKITDDQEEYELLENLVEGQKPKASASQHHYLIKTPFRYPVPILPGYAGRFTPPFHPRSGFYGAEQYRTSAYEYAYHWLSQRVHVSHLSQEPQPRTGFQVDFSDRHCVDLRSHPDVKKIMSRNDYRHSHRWMEAHSGVDSILYPSCRDPERGSCVVTFKIETLGREPKRVRTLDFIYQAEFKKCLIQDPVEGGELEIFWERVR